MLKRLIFNFCKTNVRSSKTFHCSRNFHKSQLRMEQKKKPVEKSIQKKLEEALNPVFLNIVNESFMHNVPEGSETHFKILVVSEKFENRALLARHQLVNSLLEEELKNGVHALSIVAKTPFQWNESDQMEPSPKCWGGFGK